MTSAVESELEMTPEQMAALKEQLLDPVWRINHLYKIVDKNGRVVPFRPNPPQAEVIDDIFVKGIRRITVLKSRQIGFSTLFAVIIFDATYWGENLQASIVDLTQAHATAKLQKVSFAHDALPALMREPLRQNSKSVVEFQNGSTVNAGKSARGGTNQILHISEWGPIAHDDPKRSEEIKTGALPSASPDALVWNESTFKGGKGGHFYENLKQAMQTPAALKTPKDFHFRFFAWYQDPTCTLEGDPTRVTEETHRYLDEKEKLLGITFTPGQRLFYQVTKEEQGIFMFREYPTTVEEALSAPVEGSIYGDLITRLRSKSRIIPFEYNRACPVFAFWDLGWDDSTSIWLVQQVGLDFWVIWHTRQRGHTARQMAQLLFQSDIAIAGHFIPHDGGHKRPGEGKNYKDSMMEAGLTNITVVPVTPSIWDGINYVRELLPRCYFNLPACQVGIESLEAYHTKDTSSGGVVSKEPVHDWASHDSDAFRTWAEALKLGLITTHAGKRFLDHAPRYPDGSLVAPDHVDQIRRQAHRKHADLGKFGPTPFGT